MTKENKKHIFTPTRKGLVAAALTLTLLVGAGFGVSRFVGKDGRGGGNDFGFLIANAADGAFRSVDDFAEGEALKIDTQRLHETEDFEHYVGFEYDYLELCPDIEDYSDVQSLCVRCENGNLHLDYSILWTDAAGETFAQSAGQTSTGPGANEVTISGDEIRCSRDLIRSSLDANKLAEGFPENTGFLIYWNPHCDVCEAILHGEDYDLTQVSDTITLTLTYTDGSVKAASLRFQFDENGCLQFK